MFGKIFLKGSWCKESQKRKKLKYNLKWYNILSFQNSKCLKIHLYYSFQAMVASGEGLIEMRKLEASHEISKDLARNPRITYLPSGQSAPGLLLNLSADR